MAIKDWRKVGKNRWKHKNNSYVDIGKAWGVGYYTVDLETNKVQKSLRTFSSIGDARKFARIYMQKH